MRYEVIHAKNLEWLRSQPDNSIDSFVTDPPYGLGKEPDMVKCLQDWIDHGYHEVGSPKKGGNHCLGNLFRVAPILNPDTLDPDGQKELITSSVLCNRLSVGGFNIQLNDQFSGWEKEIYGKGTRSRLKDILMDEVDSDPSKEVANIHFGLGVRKGFAPCVGVCACYTQIGNSLFSVNVRIHNDSLADSETTGGVVARRGAELMAVLTFDVTSNTVELSPAKTAGKGCAVLDLQSPELITAISRASSLPAPFEPSFVGGVNIGADGAVSFNLGTHISIFERFKNPNIQQKGFMSKTWDAFVPQPIFWKEVFRVLKPGGHVVSFGGTRTYDLMVLAIRLAGFEIRDQLMWIYGGGFPKSANVSKMIDKQAGAVREVVGSQKGKGGENLNKLARHGAGDSEDGKGMGAYGQGAKQITVDIEITAPSTPEAQQWDGWGTALSPSHEPIVLARKPLEKGLTIAQNVLKWGTGALNIDGCRIGTGEDRTSGGMSGDKAGLFEDGFHAERQQRPTGGRWPSNLLLANVPSVIGLFPENAKSGGDGTATPRNKENNSSYTIGKIRSTTSHESIGSASRYFFRADLLPIEEGELNLPIHVKAYYCSKPSKYERSLGVANGVANGVAGSYNFRTNGSLDGNVTEARANIHPTVKPVALMHHLVTLVTPPNGVCCDPFLGSGTTGIGAMLAGPKIRFIGLEMTAEYIPIATDRITNWKRYRQFVEAKATDTPSRKASGKLDAPLTLF